MIRLIDDEFEFPEIKPDCLFTRIKSSFNAYGNKYDFAWFWYQEVEGETTAVISKIDGVITLWCNDNLNKTEFLEFIAAIGFDSLVTSKSLPLCIEQTGNIYYKENKTELCKLETDLQRAASVLTNVCKIDNYNAWYTDINYRIRHGCSSAYCYLGKTCVFAHIAENSAVIFSLITLPDSRGKGYATKCLDLFEHSLKQEDIFVMCENKLNSFYEKRGYDYVNQFYIYNGRDKNGTTFF